MALFKNAIESHQHSLWALGHLREYDSFLENLTVIADMGCGQGLDTQWWATLETRDNPPEPLNYLVYAVDQNIKQLEPDVRALKNVIPVEGNFDERIIPRQVDLIWAHDSLQYSRNPLKTLANWKATMNVNGMLVLSIPQTTYIYNNRLMVTNHSHQYYSYNLLNLIYILALSGFDCRDAYFYRESNSPWLYAAVYASNEEPVPEHASWYDLADRNLINDSLIASVNRNGYARLDNIVVSWLNKENYLISD
jgi:SAM-dependent methyltransferase